VGVSCDRGRLSGPEKIAIVNRYLVERVPISDLCDEYGPQPSQIYRWQAVIFENGAVAFDLKKGRRAKAAGSAEQPATPSRNQERSTPPSATIFDRPAPPFSTAVNISETKNQGWTRQGRKASTNDC
jgi:transposase